MRYRYSELRHNLENSDYNDEGKSNVNLKLFEISACKISRRSVTKNELVSVYNNEKRIIRTRKERKIDCSIKFRNDRGKRTSIK